MLEHRPTQLGDLTHELGQVTRIIADPELAGRARDAGVESVYVLGGGGEERDLGVPAR